MLSQYFYDGEGKRVKKKVYNPDGVSVREETVFVYDGMGKLIAEYSTEPLPEKPQIKYLTEDHLGTPRIITDNVGNVIARRDFMPFGEELFINVGARAESLKYGTDKDNVRQKFTGYQKDAETELDFAEARMYENRHGRFTAVDPLLASGKSANPQTFNRYVYVMNNPLAYTDPSGLQVATCSAAAGDCRVNSYRDPLNFEYNYYPAPTGETRWQNVTRNYGPYGSVRNLEQMPVYDTFAPYSPQMEAFESYNSWTNSIANGWATGIGNIPANTGNFLIDFAWNSSTAGLDGSSPRYFSTLPYQNTTAAVSGNISGIVNTAGFGSLFNLARASALGSSATTFSGSQNVANAPRLALQLTADEASSIFTSTGGLQQTVIRQSGPTPISGSAINNPAVIKELTKDGSNIADWAKYTTPTFKSPSGPFQVHFYHNRVTQTPNFNIDYKAVFNAQQPTRPFKFFSQGN